jgi:hypothetical protein
LLDGSEFLALTRIAVFDLLNVRLLLKEFAQADTFTVETPAQSVIEERPDLIHFVGSSEP